MSLGIISLRSPHNVNMKSTNSNPQAEPSKTAVKYMLAVGGIEPILRTAADNPKITKPAIATFFRPIESNKNPPTSAKIPIKTVCINRIVVSSTPEGCRGTRKVNKRE